MGFFYSFISLSMAATAAHTFRTVSASTFNHAVNADQGNIPFEQAVETFDKGFKHDAILQEDSRITAHVTNGQSIFIEYCGEISYADDNLLPINVTNHDTNGQASVFKVLDHACDDSEVIISKINGRLLRAVKIEVDTGDRVYASCFEDGRVCTTYTEYDIDTERLEDFSYGESPPVEGGIERKSASFKVSNSPHFRGVGNGLRMLEESPSPKIIATKIHYNSSAIIQGSRISRRRSLVEDCAKMTVVRLALRYDSGFCAMHDNSALAAEAYLNFIVAGLNEWYGVTGLCHKVEICSLEGFCNGSGGRDPLRDLVEAADVVCGSDRSLLDQFRRVAYPYDQKSSCLYQCDTVHFVYGRDRLGNQPFVNEIIGCAYTGALCTTYGVGVDYFGYTTNEHLHTVLLAHELGHNLNATHTGVNDFRYIMRPAVCGQCDMFSPQTIRTIVDFTHAKQSDTCLKTERIDIPPPTEEPTTAQSDLTNDFDCSFIQSRRQCNLTPSQTCTWTKFGFCQRREDTDCYFYSRRNQCNVHGASRRCRWNDRIRVCESPATTTDLDYCVLVNKHRECEKVYKGTCAWADARGECVHRSRISCEEIGSKRSCQNGCVWNRKTRTCEDDLGRPRCKIISTKSSCSNGGCVWNKKYRTCGE